MASSEFFEGMASISQLGMAIAVGIGVWVAFRQLHAWRDELVVRKRAEVAEQLLALALTVSDELKALRSQFDSIPKAELGNKKFVYERRMRRFQDRHELFIRLREAQVRAEAVLDDPEINEAVDELFKVRSRTITAIDILAEDRHSSDDDLDSKDFYKSLRLDMYGSYTKKHDPLGMKQLEAIATLKKVLKPSITYEISSKKV